MPPLLCNLMNKHNLLSNNLTLFKYHPLFSFTCIFLQIEKFSLIRHCLVKKLQLNGNGFLGLSAVTSGKLESMAMHVNVNLILGF